MILLSIPKWFSMNQAIRYQMQLWLWRSMSHKIINSTVQYSIAKYHICYNIIELVLYVNSSTPSAWISSLLKSLCFLEDSYFLRCLAKLDRFWIKDRGTENIFVFTWMSCIKNTMIITTVKSKEDYFVQSKRNSLLKYFTVLVMTIPILW